MTCSSTITIDGYPLDTMRHTYTVWQHFEKKDRIIRCRRPQRNRHILDIPDAEQWTPPRGQQYAYSVTADVLRKRLGRAGYTRTTLEQEFLKYYSTVCRQSGTMFFNTSSELALARAEAFRAATLDDWLEALEETVRTGVNRVGRNAGEFGRPENILVDIISGSDEPSDRNLMPYHSLLGFPCTSLNNMAVALLEVVPGDAACEQEVSMFIEYKGETTFDDMRIRKRANQNIYHDENEI